MKYFLLTLLIASFNVYSEEKLETWMIYSNPGAVTFSIDLHKPIQGKSVASTSALLSELNDKSNSQNTDKYIFGWLDYFYLSQTINAKNYQNQHLHISGYLKIDQSKSIAHLNKYKNISLNKKISFYNSKGITLDQKKLEIPRDVVKYRNMFNKTEVKVKALLVVEGNLIEHETTDYFTTSSERWQRLDLPFDVPENCTSITILVSMKGVGELYIDDFVVVNKGKMLNYKGNKVRIGRLKLGFREMLAFWVNSAKNTYAFTNLGFENTDK